MVHFWGAYFHLNIIDIPARLQKKSTRKIQCLQINASFVSIFLLATYKLEEGFSFQNCRLILIYIYISENHVVIAICRKKYRTGFDAHINGWPCFATAGCCCYLSLLSGPWRVNEGAKGEKKERGIHRYWQKKPLAFRSARFEKKRYS